MKAWPLPGVTAEVLLAPHPGSFAAVRKYDVHCGVDLYCPDGSRVVAVESGTVVTIETYTGPNAIPPSPWWHETHSCLVEGESGVICYGEIATDLRRGQVVLPGDRIGTVKRVLRNNKGKPTSMLHFELYRTGTRKSEWWYQEEEGVKGNLMMGAGRPITLLDPTELLLSVQE